MLAKDSQMALPIPRFYLDQSGELFHASKSPTAPVTTEIIVFLMMTVCFEPQILHIRLFSLEKVSRYIS